MHRDTAADRGSNGAGPLSFVSTSAKFVGAQGAPRPQRANSRDFLVISWRHVDCV